MLYITQVIQLIAASCGLLRNDLHSPSPTHYEVAQSPHENSMSGANTRSVLTRFGDNNWEKGEDFVKTFYVQKTGVEAGGELERARAR